MRRLTDRELDAGFSDLVGVEVVVSGQLIGDPRVDGYDGDARALVVSGPKLDGYITAIEPVATKLATRAGCAPQEPPRLCAARFAHAFAPKAFGRPVEDEEVTGHGIGGEHAPHIVRQPLERLSKVRR